MRENLDLDGSASARARVERIARAEDRIAKNVPRCRGWLCGQVSGAFDDVTSTRRVRDALPARVDSLQRTPRVNAATAAATRRFEPVVDYS